MLITGREAARILRDTGLTRERSRRLLAAGFAGEPIRAAGAHLYEQDRIVELARRPRIDKANVVTWCPDGLFVARRDVNVAASWADRADAVRGPWECGRGTRVFLQIMIDRAGPFPMVGTVCGFVAVGAEIVDIRATPSGVDARETSMFELREAGTWFHSFRDARLPTGPGRPWSIFGWNRNGFDRAWYPLRPGPATRP